MDIKRLVALTIAAVALVPVPAARAAVPILTIDGRGWGHGVGMSQAGARWMSVDGATTAQILQLFYPGTGSGTASGPVRVVVHSVPSQTVVAFPAGGEVRSPRSGAQHAGFPIRVGAGGQVRISFDGRYRAEPLVVAQSTGEAVHGQLDLPPLDTTSSTSTTTSTLLPQITTPTTAAPTTTVPRAPTTSTTRPGGSRPGGSTTTTTRPPAGRPDARVTSSSPLWIVPGPNGTVALPDRGRRYRGVVEATAAAGPLRLLNEVDVEQYLRGMGEVRDPRWPQASLMAQAIVARTYALRAMRANGELCDYELCQVYLGQQAEYGAMDQAVAASRGQVVTFGRGLASSVYSANAGGVSATTLEGFGTSGEGYPYLRATRYTTRDPFPWKVDVAIADVAKRFGYKGALRGARVTQIGPSGRVLEITLSGDKGDTVVRGRQFASRLGLRSTLFTLRLGQADAAPPAPDQVELIQALPDDEVTLRKASRITEDSPASVARQRRQAAPASSRDDDSDGLAPWFAVALLGVLTAAGMARWGPPDLLASLGNRSRSPGTQEPML